MLCSHPEEMSERDESDPCQTISTLYPQSTTGVVTLQFSVLEKSHCWSVKYTQVFSGAIVRFTSIMKRTPPVAFSSSFLFTDRITVDPCFLFFFYTLV